MALADLLAAFRTTVAETQGFINAAFDMNASGYIYSKPYRDFVTQSGYLKIFVAWENYLEGCYMSYMLGEVPISGRAVVRYVSPLSKDHAIKILKRKPNDRYFDWSNPEEIVERSKVHFIASNPIATGMGSAAVQDIFQMRVVRNSAAHNSSASTTALHSVVQKIHGEGAPPMTVSDLLLSINPHLGTAPAKTVLQGYIETLDATAAVIATG